MALDEYLGADLREEIRRLLHSLPGHVRIGIARTEERRSSGEVAGEGDRLIERADQASREGEHRGVALRMPPDEFCRETGSLRESGDADSLCRDPCRRRQRERGFHLAKRRREIRLVLAAWREE